MYKTWMQSYDRSLSKFNLGKEAHFIFKNYFDWSFSNGLFLKIENFQNSAPSIKSHVNQATRLIVFLSFLCSFLINKQKEIKYVSFTWSREIDNWHISQPMGSFIYFGGLCKYSISHKIFFPMRFVRGRGKMVMAKGDKVG